MKITLPDNSSRELPEGSSGYDLAKDIGPGLAKSAIAVTIDGVQKDLHDIINTLDIPRAEKSKLLKLTPSTYLGLSSKLAKHI